LAFLEGKKHYWCASFLTQNKMSVQVAFI